MLIVEAELIPFRFLILKYNQMQLENFSEGCQVQKGVDAATIIQPNVPENCTKIKKIRAKRRGHIFEICLCKWATANYTSETMLYCSLVVAYQKCSWIWKLELTITQTDFILSSWIDFDVNLSLIGLKNMIWVLSFEISFITSYAIGTGLGD